MLLRPVGLKLKATGHYERPPNASQGAHGLHNGGVSSDRSTAAIQARSLRKTYGRVTAVDGVDLTVQAGDVYGFLGPNGAGKTTTLRMLLGLIKPEAGSIELFGTPIERGAAARAGVAGFVETPRFYPYLSARKNLRLCATYDRDPGANPRIDPALELVDLAARADDKAGGFSYGMRQRLGIAAALVRDPRLLILDEPTLGLDPAGMRDMRQLVKRLSGEGITILLSSHVMGEVEDVCDRVAIIRAGSIVHEGTIAELKSSGAGGYRLHTGDDAAALAILRSDDGVRGLSETAEGLHFTAPAGVVEQLVAALVGAGIGVRAVVPEGDSLEALFFRFTEGDQDAAATVADSA